MSSTTEQERFVPDAERDAGSVRAALLAGFAIVFGLWLLWGYQLVHSLQRIEQNVTTVHESYVRGEQTLSKIRTNILLASFSAPFIFAMRSLMVRGGNRIGSS